MKSSPIRGRGRLYIIPALVILIVMICYPMIHAILMSMQDTQIYTIMSPPHFTFFRNYIDLLNDEYFLNSIGRTVIYTVMVVLIQVVLGMVFALMISRVEKCRTVFTTLITIPIMITPAVVGLMWRFLLDSHLGLYSYIIAKISGTPISFLGNHGLALFTIAGIDIWWQTPFVILIFLAGLTSLPVDVFEASFIDGASGFQQFLNITLPLMKPLIGLAVIMRAIEAFKAFDYIWVLTGGGPGTATELISVYILKTAFHSGNLSYGAAASLLLALMLFFVALVLFRSTFHKKGDLT